VKTFSAKVVDASGKKSVIIENAISIDLFEDSLSKRGFFIIEAKEALEGSRTFSDQKIKKKFLLDLSYNVYTLLDFGIDINEVFRIASEIYTTGKEADFIRNVISFLKKGEKLSKAIKKAKGGEIFDDFFLTMVSAGEQSGKLADAFKLIYSYLKTNQKIKEKLISAAVYPLLLSVMAFGVLHLLLLFIIPIVMQIYTNMDFKPKPLINAIFVISELMTNNIVIYLIFLALLAAGAVIFFRTKISKRIIDTLLMKAPITSKIIMINTKIKLSFSLEILLKGGYSLEEALSKLGELEEDKSVKKEYIKGLETLKEGGGVRNAFKSIKIFEAKDLNIIEIADSISKAPEGFQKIYSDAIQSLESFLERLFELLNPVIMLFIGMFIFFIMYLLITPTLAILENF
jgi:type IV pilus assembly protein PilC